MLKLFLIGRSASKNEYEDPLVTLGYSIRKFDSLDKAIHSLNERPDIIIADKKLSNDPSFKDFLKLTKNIPKIVITDIHSFKGFSPWLKEIMIYPLYI
jgi:hypothetical protein